jgi:hypothetical protein
VARFPWWLVPPCLLVASEVMNEAPMMRIRVNGLSLIVLRRSPTGGARPLRSCGLSAVRCNDPRAPRRAGGGDCNFCLSPGGEGKDSDDAAPQSVDEGRATHHPFARGEPEQQAPHGSATKEEKKEHRVGWRGFEKWADQGQIWPRRRFLYLFFFSIFSVSFSFIFLNFKFKSEFCW